MAINSYGTMHPVPVEPDDQGRHVFRVSEHVRTSHGPNGATVLDIRLGQMFTINAVGSKVLKFLECGAQESEIIDRVCQDFGVSKQTAGSDVREFLLALEQNGLIEEQAWQR